MKKFCLFALGTPVVDYFARADERLLKHQQLRKSASNFMGRQKLDSMCALLGRKISHSFPGDNARNVCEGVSYLGGKCAYAGSLANDKEGKIFSSNLRMLCVFPLLQKLPGSSGKILTLITTDKARTFAVSLGNSEGYSKLPFSALASSSIFYVSSITALSQGKIGKTSMRLLSFAKKHRVPVAFSLESPPMIKERRKELLSLLEKFPPQLLFANEGELRALGIKENKFRTLAKIAILKKGAKGAQIYCPAGVLCVPAIKTKVVDTTGAGDYFAAGFISGFCKGKGLRQCAAIGAKLAARAISRVGASVF